MESFDETELRKRLTPEEYAVTQESATERAFTGKYWDEKATGTYSCIVCEEPLFDSDTKYDSGSGWPSFTEPVDQQSVTRVEDNSHGMRRIEVICSKCGAHLGHVFPDGPGETGERHCINSASLSLEERS